ncbi:MAG TPA: HAD family hydrolase [Verrucomicrobiae bacterium]|nr:HAD family hydrolase [Verrucomicrobiae bacterium]
MARLVLFDIDGTLIRTGGAGVKAFAWVFKTFFNASDGFERLKFSGRTDGGIIREFFAVHHVPPTRENFERFIDAYVFWLDHLLSQNGCEVCPGVRELIRDFQALESPPVIGLLTGNIRLGAEIKLRHAGLWDLFATGAFADDSENRDEIAAVARERGSRLLGERLHPKDVIVIGDTPLDIKCARAIGARALAVATGGATLQELHQHTPDWAVTDLRQIEAAALRRINGAPLATAA